MNDKNEMIKDVLHVSGMYENWFLDYASYVILERSVPLLSDGLKPVQRRILHSLKELEDGRFHKVANVIGHTMKYHPHGDASIGDALVQIGQKDLLLDMQGNWGNTLTGDRAAAPRYIEVRLSKFALDVVYNNKITTWNKSYDGRGKEPKALPIKFPLLLAQGVEGIAVGLSTKILPHNFTELIDASIKILKGSNPKIYPDFPNGGMADFTNYNDGKRGGKIRVRAKILIEDKKTLKITELPHSITTSSLINSIVKSNDKGKIKIKKIEDNTSENVEILIHLPAGISPDKTIDALYSFTDCETSISPLGCVIENDKPIFLGVSEILNKSTYNTLDILEKELRFNLNELKNKWHFSSLEKIFIENRIYRDIEECETWESIISTIHKGLKPFISVLFKDVNDDDVARLTEIKIKRISKFDVNKANKDILVLEEKIKKIEGYLNNLTHYAIEYFKNLKAKYGTKRLRKTEIKTFDNIVASKVVAKNQKLYVNREEGFIGTSMRKDEFVSECSDIDDIIVIRKDGKMLVTKVDKKTFVGKNIIHVSVFKKKDDRTTYNMIYKQHDSGKSYMKRFQVTGVTRDKEYEIAKGQKSEILYFTSNPNGEAELVTIHLRALRKLKKLKFDIDFSELMIKGRASTGNLVTKNSIKRIDLKEDGVSTLSARKIWYDDTVMKLNVDGRGDFLGDFNPNDKILTVKQDGTFQLIGFELSSHFSDDMILIEKWKKNNPISVIYFDPNKERYFVKRFLIEDNLKEINFLSNSNKLQLELVCTYTVPIVEIKYVKERGKDRVVDVVNLKDFISIKGVGAQGNRLTDKSIKEINLLPSSLDETQLESNENPTESQDISIDDDKGINQFKLDF